MALAEGVARRNLMECFRWLMRNRRSPVVHGPFLGPSLALKLSIPPSFWPTGFAAVLAITAQQLQQEGGAGCGNWR
jgi:hypothetical protein